MKTQKAGYSRAILPNETETTENEGYYEVTENGDYTFTAYDKVGNRKTITKTITCIDKTPPEIVLSLSSEELEDKEIYIIWQAVDYQSGIDRVLLPNNQISNELNGQFKISGPGIYKFIAYDKVGNEKIASLKVSNVDMRKPKLEITQEYMEWTNENAILHWRAKDNETGIQEIVLPNSDRTKLEEGIFEASKNGTYAFIAYDKVGNGTLVYYTVNNIDKDGPKLTLELLEDGKTIKWQIEDEKSDIKNIILPTGEKISRLNSGTFETSKKGTYTFMAYDKIGNYTIQKITI